MKLHLASGIGCRPDALPTRFHSYVSRLAVRGCAATLLCTLIPRAACAQTFTTLANFAGTNGASPYFGVLAQGTDGNLYGTTSAGGAHGKGTVFKITPTGTLTTLYSFCAQSKCTDGSTPYGGLALGTDGNFYGTTELGGTGVEGGQGTVFKITPAGKLTTLVSFNYHNGANPYDSLLLANDGNFYGTTESGGTHLLGTVFKITPQGVLTALHSFNQTDGAEPEAPLIQASDGNFYGTTYNGGSGGYGTVFKITPSGTLTNLHTFNDDTEGRAIVSGLVEGADGNFFGTASLGGPSGYGTIYMITSTGTLTVLHSFDESDGSAPNQLLLATDGNFYGTTISSGSAGDGTIFEFTPQGVLTTLHDFSGTDGALPFAGVAQATNGTFYGTTLYGGTKRDGVVFSLDTGLGAFVETVPTSGAAGAGVTILGTNLTGATSVMFNGTPASFTVVSASEITATVPTGATTGTVEVTTPSGTLSSSVPFSIP